MPRAWPGLGQGWLVRARFWAVACGTLPLPEQALPHPALPPPSPPPDRQLAHKLGSYWHVPHGLANAALITHGG